MRTDDSVAVRKFAVALDGGIISPNTLLLIQAKTGDVGEVSRSLETMDEILEVYEVMGERNIACKAVVHNMTELKCLMKKINQTKVGNVEFSIVLKAIKGEYLHNRK